MYCACGYYLHALHFTPLPAVTPVASLGTLIKHLNLNWTTNCWYFVLLARRLSSHNRVTSSPLPPGTFAGRWTSWSMIWCQHWRRAPSRRLVEASAMGGITLWRWAACWRGRRGSGGAGNDAQTTRILPGRPAIWVRAPSPVLRNTRWAEWTASVALLLLMNSFTLLFSEGELHPKLVFQYSRLVLAARLFFSSPRCGSIFTWSCLDSDWTNLGSRPVKTPTRTW